LPGTVKVSTRLPLESSTFDTRQGATLATFLALFVTSRPYDPMDSTIAPQQGVPQGPVTPSPSPKPSPTTTPAIQGPSSGQVNEPAGETKVAAIDEATIQAEIEKTIAGDSTLSTLDLSTIVEGGKVTLAGSVRSPDLKQRVEKAVRSVKGIVSVDNQKLRVARIAEPFN